ncbi:FAD-dependent oxidoreductase [Humitalea sp. 24SJ18S-53]|uniref:FAD-dependent oxidoreductase n=1 Tax=Humitalea sp. 24SJ18S-53 TaxID=3422307 RepID=UPI003D66B008
MAPTRSDQTLIVGGGPVGMTAALSLARRGIPVRVLEAGPDFAADPRASSTHPSTLDMLEELGLEVPMMAQGYRVDCWQFWDRMDGPIIKLELGELAGLTRHPFRLQLEQHRLCGIIQQALKTHGVEVAFNSRVTALRQDEDGVVATVDGPGGTREETGRFLIGADGGRSTIRKSLGISFEGYSLSELFVVVTTEYPFGQHGYADACHFADPDQWATLFRTPNGGAEPFWRISMPAMSNLSEDEARNFDRCSERLAILLPEGARATVFHANLYGVHQRVAGTFRLGRVLLAGDAAHVNGPTGALGMNFGIQDAVFLAEQLARVYAEPADTTPLDRYDRQRRVLAEAILQKQPQLIKARLELRDAEARKARNAALRAMGTDTARRMAFLKESTMLDSVAQSAALGAG